MSSDGTRTTWSYDSTGQLVQEVRNGTNSLNITHMYDLVGNRTLQNAAGTRVTYTYDVANELTLAMTGSARTTYLSDNAGNRSQMTAPAGTTYYHWDAHDRMVLAEPVSGSTTYAYNGVGQRVSKKVSGVTTQFVWDFQKVLQEADGSSGATEKQYLSTDQQYGDLVSGYDGTNTRYYDFDALGSAEALLDNTGSAIDQYAYQAFGLMTQTLGTDIQPYTWVGKRSYQQDTETGLYLLGGGKGGRYYDPGTARFMTKDPIEYHGGTPNLYEYCANDPVTNADPSGLHFKCCKITKVTVVTKAKETPDAAKGIMFNLGPAEGYMLEANLNDPGPYNDPKKDGDVQLVIWVVFEGKNLENCSYRRFVWSTLLTEYKNMKIRVDYPDNSGGFFGWEEKNIKDLPPALPKPDGPNPSTIAVGDGNKVLVITDAPGLAPDPKRGYPSVLYSHFEVIASNPCPYKHTVAVIKYNTDQSINALGDVKSNEIRDVWSTVVD